MSVANLPHARCTYNTFTHAQFPHSNDRNYVRSPRVGANIREYSNGLFQYYKEEAAMEVDLIDAINVTVIDEA